MTKNASRQLEISIPGLPATFNSIGRSHWSVKAKEARKWISLVRYYVSESNLGFVPMNKVNVTFTRISPRPIDPDNVPQTFKHVMDGLVKACVIVDDGPDNIVGLTYKQEKCKKGFESIKVMVEEV